MAAGWKACPQSAHGLPCFKLVYQARNSFCLRLFFVPSPLIGPIVLSCLLRLARLAPCLNTVVPTVELGERLDVVTATTSLQMSCRRHRRTYVRMQGGWCRVQLRPRRGPEPPDRASAGQCASRQPSRRAWRSARSVARLRRRSASTYMTSSSAAEPGRGRARCFRSALPFPSRSPARRRRPVRRRPPGRRGPAPRSRSGSGP